MFIPRDMEAEAEAAEAVNFCGSESWKWEMGSRASAATLPIHSERQKLERVCNFL